MPIAYSSLSDSEKDTKPWTQQVVEAAAKYVANGKNYKSGPPSVQDFAKCKENLELVDKAVKKIGKDHAKAEFKALVEILGEILKVDYPFEEKALQEECDKLAGLV